jgi:O-acetyl-ADP-ribose deacetylase (regulator of RNase III)
MLEIKIQKGDITKVQAEAIVNPANSYGWMGGGSAMAIIKKGGVEIEREVKDKAPLEIGQAVATKAGKLPYKYVIHAPTMISPTEKAQPYNVQMSVLGALILADDLKLKSIAMPGMGTGVGAFPVKEAAQVMIEEIKKFTPLHLEQVILIDLNEKLVDAWENEMKK